MSFVSMACWTVAAFTPPPGLPRQAAVRAAVPEATVRAATMHADGLAASAVQYTVALPMMYALLSAHEVRVRVHVRHLTHALDVIHRSRLGAWPAGGGALTALTRELRPRRSTCPTNI
eukprot:6622153-Prymnesium_polylepis.1